MVIVHHLTLKILSIYRKIADFTSTIETSDYFNQSIEIVSTHSKLPITKIVCFGIGRIRHCKTSRYQLGYILALRKHFKVDSIQFHEPLLSHQHDKDLLNALHCELVTVNVEGKLEIDSTETTVAFLPHCPKQLVNNLLWKNWSANALQPIILISNSFHAIVQQTPISCIDQDAGYINRIERYTSEFSLENSFEHKNVFNDIGIHFFNDISCTNQIFDYHLEPSYGISELIESTDQLSIRWNGFECFPVTNSRTPTGQSEWCYEQRFARIQIHFVAISQIQNDRSTVVFEKGGNAIPGQHLLVLLEKFAETGRHSEAFQGKWWKIGQRYCRYGWIQTSTWSEVTKKKFVNGK